jgi:uncharacterized protein YjbK
MTTLSTETEFKFAVKDESAFAALAAILGLPPGVLDYAVLQTNHFFDTAQSSLRTHGIAIRLREQSGAYYLTIKGGSSSRSEDGLLTSRIEEERLLDPDTAHAMLDGSIPVQSIIAAHFKDHSSQLVDLIDTLSRHHALTYVGKFENRRITLPPVRLHDGGNTHPLEFELDSITFPGQAPQYEIEVEVPSPEEASLIRDALVSLLSAAGIEWRAAESKARRFFAIIDTIAEK